MKTHTQKPAESSQAPTNAPQVKNASTLSPKAKQCLELLAVRCRTVSGSLDMLTAFNDPSVIGSQVMLNDAECLLETARRLHEALSKNDEPKSFKFTYDGITGLITGSNLDWILWGGIGFSRSSAKDGLKVAIDSAVSEPKAKGGFQINSPRRVTLADLIKQQNLERGLEPLPLESDLLLKRIAQGGHSGHFLADAFISAYRTDKPFKHSLGQLINLDPEGFRLFHQILHIRHISGWSDDHLYNIEQQIIAIRKGGR